MNAELAEFEIRLLNGLCRLLYKGEYERFISPCNIGRVQAEYLTALLKKNADTVYGRKYGFGKIRCYKDFAKRVPLTKYEDYEPYIKAMANGAENVLTSERVLLFELTSGSSGGKKLIPYTPSLKREFQRGIKPWLCDIYTKLPEVRSGKSYWSITPVTEGKSRTKSGIPIGFEEDAEYFGFIEQGIMRRIFAVDGSVKFPENTDRFYFETARQMLNCGSLTLISVWNPTFLTILCGHIRDNAKELAKTLPEERRGGFIRAVSENRFERVFPRLRIISCWADGSAADHIMELRERFRGVYIQPKGLLATECFVSFPLVGEEGSRLSVYSHFFEFRRLSDGKIVTAGRLRCGEYEIIVTTDGGFYRYCIGDIIEVLETYPDRPPRIRFLRRGGVSSDLFGEKLTEEFVRGTLIKLRINGSFCLLAPYGKRYRLYTTAENITSEALDAALREGFHYDYCRRLGQLDRAEVVQITGAPNKNYIEKLTADGMRIGDIKPAVLSARGGWENYFTERKLK